MEAPSSDNLAEGQVMNDASGAWHTMPDCKENSTAPLEGVRIFLISAAGDAVTLAKSTGTSAKQGSFPFASHFPPPKGFFSSLAACSSRYQQSIFSTAKETITHGQDHSLSMETFT